MPRGLSSQVRVVIASGLLAAAGAICQAQTTVDEGFTYQGRLSEDGSLATGTYDFRFQLFSTDTGGAILSQFDVADLGVTSGLFQTKVFFGKFIKTTEKRWMQVLVRPGASTGAFTALGDRQELNAVPFATRAIIPPTMQEVFNASSFPTVAVGATSFCLNPPTSNDEAFRIFKGFGAIGSGQVAPGSLRTFNGTLDTLATGFLGPVTNGLGAGDGLALWDLGGATGSGVARSLAYIGPGPQSSGGQLALSRDTAGNLGVLIQGNAAGGSPKLTLTNGASAILLDPGASSATSKVVLPIDAIQREEIQDEPGVANATQSGSVAVGLAMAAAHSASITAPADGFVMVIASGRATVNHVTGTATSLVYGVSISPTSVGATQQQAITIPASAPTGSYVIPCSTHAIFSVASGASTFFLNAQRSGGGASSATLSLVTQSCVYFPTKYGSITAPRPAAPGTPPMRGPLTDAELQDSVAGAAAANQDRIGRELAEMRQRLAELEAELARRQAPALRTAGSEGVR